VPALRQVEGSRAGAAYAGQEIFASCECAMPDYGSARIKYLTDMFTGRNSEDESVHQNIEVHHEKLIKPVCYN
jgi:hypothetical protein